MKEILAEQRTPEWHNARKGVIITGSRIAGWLGVSPWGSKEDTLRACVRDSHGVYSEFNGNVATQWGNDHEEEAIEQYEATTMQVVERHGLCLHDEYHWIGYSPDGRVGNKLIEVKCPYSQKIPEEVPEHYWLQVQLGMEVMGLSSCDFIYWIPGAMKVFHVERDPEWFQKILPELKECHKLYKKEVKNKAHLEDKHEQMTGAEWEAAVVDWRWAKQSLTGAETKEKEARERLLALVGDRSVEGSGIRITRVERQGSVQYKNIPELQGVDLEQYRSEGSVSFRIQEKK